MKKSIVLAFSIVVLVGLFRCGHTHEQTPVMKEIVEMNVKLWEDLNAAKSEVKTRLRLASTVASQPDSLEKIELGAELNLLMEQKRALADLDKIIPELKGYEPKCNHEPGEAHSHNTVDVNGLDEKDLLEIHKELTVALKSITDKLKK